MYFSSIGNNLELDTGLLSGRVWADIGTGHSLGGRMLGKLIRLVATVKESLICSTSNAKQTNILEIRKRLHE